LPEPGFATEPQLEAGLGILEHGISEVTDKLVE
jgi:hypothetical protein